MASLAAATQRTRRRLASAASKPRRRRRRRRDLPPRHYDNTTPLSRPARRALAEGLDDLALQRLRKLAEGPPLLVGELGTSSHKELVKTIYQVRGAESMHMRTHHHLLTLCTLVTSPHTPVSAAPGEPVGTNSKGDIVAAAGRYQGAASTAGHSSGTPHDCSQYAG